jgi:hypothetical protein
MHKLKIRMSKPIRYESIQEPLDEEERELMDPDYWDWESAEEGVPVPNAGTILAISFTSEEIAQLEQTARAEGIGLHEFIKRLALAAVSTPTP